MAAAGFTGGVAEALILGLSTGPVCLAACGPAVTPWLLTQPRGVRQHTWQLALFLAARLAAYLVFACLVWAAGSALLRAWMNWVRVNMSAQPGSFVMALTDWLVKPLRRALPRPMAQSRVDWASVIAAAVLALAYAVLWALLFGLLLGTLELAPLVLLTLLSFAIKMLFRVALQTLFILVLGFAILSWVQPGSPAYALLGRLTDPVLAPLRRVIPVIGGVDLSALVLTELLSANTKK